MLLQETEVKLDNLQDAELRALLDEAVQYRGKREGEQRTELFQVMSTQIPRSNSSAHVLFFTPTLKGPFKGDSRIWRRKSSSFPTDSPTCAGSKPTLSSPAAAAEEVQEGELALGLRW